MHFLRHANLCIFLLPMNRCTSPKLCYQGVPVAQEVDMGPEYSILSTRNPGYRCFPQPGKNRIAFPKIGFDFFFTKGGISEECGWWLCISCRWGSWHHLLVKIRYYKNILIFLKPSIQISWHHLLVRLWYYEIFQYSGNLEFKYLGIICCICLFGTAFLFLRT